MSSAVRPRRVLRDVAARLAGRRSPHAALALVVGATFLLGAHRDAAAHVATIGYSHITQTGSTVTRTLYLDPFHLDTFLQLDEDHDGEVGAGEVRAQAEAIRQMVAPRLEAMDVATGERPVATAGEVSLTTMGETGLSGDGFTTLSAFPLVAVPLTFEFAELRPADLLLTYGLFLEVGFGDHNNTARVDAPGASATVVFELEEPAVLVGDLPGVADHDTTDADSRTWMGVVAAVLLGGAVLATAAVALRRAQQARRPISPPTTPPRTRGATR